MSKSTIQFSLSPQDYNLLLETLSEMPYKQVHQLITKLQEQIPENKLTECSSQFNIGDKIQARWKGGPAWYSGTIQDIQNGKYFIKYDDGDEEWTTVDLISRPIQTAHNPNSKEPLFKIGDRVNARWKGAEAWYSGTIQDVQNDKYFIKYDDGDEEWTTADCIQLIA